MLLTAEHRVGGGSRHSRGHGIRVPFYQRTILVQCTGSGGSHLEAMTGISIPLGTCSWACPVLAHDLLCIPKYRDNPRSNCVPVE